MIQKYNRYKVLQVFFDFPRKKFQIRELVRLIGITQPALTKHIKELVKEGFLIKNKEGIYPSYLANRANSEFRLYKKLNLIMRLNSSGLIDYLYDLFLPKSIVLFGSGSKGEDIEESDIDLFVESSNKNVDLSKYEKLLCRKINLFNECDFTKLSNELKNNIINGQVIKGYLSVF